jgi:energy-coupling factor transport system ATP-binding protein
MKITYEHVTYSYNSEVSPALKDVNLEFDTKHLIGICGATGSGKSTLIQHINGILKPNSGRMLIDGKDIHRSPESLRQVRQRVGMTFQFPERQLFGRTVWEELSYILEQRHIPKEEIDQRLESVSDLLKFDLQSHRDRSPFALSRGEQRKLGIAVILSLHPELLVLDEPTAGMDRGSSYQFLDVLHALHYHNNLQIILVSHNVELLLKYTDRLIVVSEGEVVFVGTPVEMITASERLTLFGISLPPVNKILHLLQKKYPQINSGIISASDAVEEVMKYI